MSSGVSGSSDIQRLEDIVQSVKGKISTPDEKISIVWKEIALKEIAFINTRKGEECPVIGWLQRAQKDGASYFTELLGKREFDQIRSDQIFPFLSSVILNVFENLFFGFERAPGLGDRKSLNIINIDRLAITQSRGSFKAKNPNFEIRSVY